MCLHFLGLQILTSGVRSHFLALGKVQDFKPRAHDKRCLQMCLHPQARTPFPQCSSAFFLSSSTKLLLYLCYVSHGLVTHATSSFSALLNLLSPSYVFLFTGHTGSLHQGVNFSFSFSSFLQCWARYLNPLHFQYSFSCLPSNFALSEARACFSLSKLLMMLWYYC